MQIDSLVLGVLLAKMYMESCKAASTHELRDALSIFLAAHTEVLQLIDLILIMHVTTAQNERVISTLKRIKN